MLPYIFCQLHSKRPYNKKNITRQLKDMDFMFSWQEQYLTRSLRSLVRYCCCHSNIKSISLSCRVISSIYYLQNLFSVRDFGYNVRNSELKLNLHKPHTNFLKRSLCYSGASLRNNLPQDIRSLPNESYSHLLMNPTPQSCKSVLVSYKLLLYCIIDRLIITSLLLSFSWL